MPVVNFFLLQFIHGPVTPNEINNRSMNPLAWLPNADLPRQPTATETTAFYAMSHCGPMFHGGVIPSGQNVQSVERGNSQGVDYTII